MIFPMAKEDSTLDQYVDLSSLIVDNDDDYVEKKYFIAKNVLY